MKQRDTAQVETELTALWPDFAAALKDAKRYRWLRRDAPYDECAAVFDKHSGAELDAAIDDAMSREEE
jgi:hypothetical protein